MSGSVLENPRESGRVCPFCGGANFQLLHEWAPDHIRNSATIPVGYWECDCKLAILDPVPTPAQLPSNGDWWSPERKMVYRRLLFKKIRTAVGSALIGISLPPEVRTTVAAGSAWPDSESTARTNMLPNLAPGAWSRKSSCRAKPAR